MLVYLVITGFQRGDALWQIGPQDDSTGCLLSERCPCVVRGDVAINGSFQDCSSPACRLMICWGSASRALAFDKLLQLLREVEKVPLHSMTSRQSLQFLCSRAAHFLLLRTAGCDFEPFVAQAQARLKRPCLHQLKPHCMVRDRIQE